MQNKSKLALAAAIGLTGLFALAANAQQSAVEVATPPAAAAPATTPPAATPPAESNSGNAADTSNNSAAANAGKSGAREGADYNRQRWSRHHGKGRHGHSRRHAGHHGRDGQRYGHHGRRSESRRYMRNMSDEDRKAFFEARIASVRAGLMLNETQARLWPFVETAVREMADKRRAWRERIKKEGRLENPFDRMKRRADRMADRAAGMQKFATAAKPLYDTLTVDQKRRLQVLTRGMRNFSHMRRMYR